MSLRRWSGLALVVVSMGCGVLLQLGGYPLVGSQRSGTTVVHYVSLVLVALLLLAVLGLLLMVWPGRED